MRADALLDTGDMAGAAAWRMIIKAIEVLQATEPDGAFLVQRRSTPLV